MKNGIYLVATPIGNIKDISLRAIEVLNNAEIVACEDTRVTKKLFSLLNIPMVDKNFVAVHDHNERKEVFWLAEKAKDTVVAYVSDAGSPLISDPGYKLAKACYEKEVYLTTIPGPCALVCGLQLSGLPTNNFMFVGFIPNKDKARMDLFKRYKDIDTTLIFYETANRLLKTLSSMKKVFNGREVAVVREITKVFEECKKGSIDGLSEYYEINQPKGEIVLLVAPQMEKEKIDFEVDLRYEMKENSLKDAVKLIAEKYNLNKNEVYKKALELKND